VYVQNNVGGMDVVGYSFGGWELYGDVSPSFPVASLPTTTSMPAGDMNLFGVWLPVPPPPVNTWQIRNVDSTVIIPLPFAPKKIAVTNAYAVDSFGVDGVGSILVSRYAQAKNVAIDGFLMVAGAQNRQLVDQFLIPLDLLEGQVVQLVDPDGQFDNASGWVFHWSYTREQKASQVWYDFQMTFQEPTGSNTIITMGANS
jgi:hypothetical protein